jgi:hypothetical protein
MLGLIDADLQRQHEPALVLKNTKQNTYRQTNT